MAFISILPARKTIMEMVLAELSRRTSLSLLLMLLDNDVPVPTELAMPFGSMIMITEPSPRMVLPENILMWRSLLDIGFTTISSVWNTVSTTMPKTWLPT